MSRYSRGAAFEYQVKHDLESKGFVCVRAAGSHTPVDVYAFGNGRIVFVQCKTDGRLDPGEWNELIDYCELAGATPILADKPRRGVIRYRQLTGKKDKQRNVNPPIEDWEV